MFFGEFYYRAALGVVDKYPLSDEYSLAVILDAWMISSNATKPNSGYEFVRCWLGAFGFNHSDSLASSSSTAGESVARPENPRRNGARA
jgi:hypothetical protein